MLHDAVTAGSLEELQNLLTSPEDCAKRRKLALCKDASGVGLLHKAVYYDLADIYTWLAESYPQTATLKDSEGRTPVHYVAMCKDEPGVLKLLSNAGADVHEKDNKGHTYRYYVENPGELELPSRHRPLDPRSAKDTG